MGTPLSQLRENHKEADTRAKEQLALLEKTGQAQLKSKVNEILHGSEDDEQIHSGKVVAMHQQVSVNASTKSDGIDSTINSFFSGDFLGGMKSLILTGVHELLGNNSIGENEKWDMVIVWENNALVRCDTYYWKYNFSSTGIIDEVENIFAVYCVKRVIDTKAIDPNVLIYSITQMYLRKHSNENDEALDYMRKLMGKLKETRELISDN